jgi:hypothetical protein
MIKSQSFADGRLVDRSTGKDGAPLHNFLSRLTANITSFEIVVDNPKSSSCRFGAKHKNVPSCDDNMRKNGPPTPNLSRKHSMERLQRPRLLARPSQEVLNRFTQNEYANNKSLKLQDQCDLSIAEVQGIDAHQSYSIYLPINLESESEYFDTFPSQAREHQSDLEKVGRNVRMKL